MLKSVACEVIDDHRFIDSVGHEFVVDKPYERIVSLYSAHTENLYTYGAGDLLIGAGRTSIYPAQAADLQRFDYREDPEPLIAANPDLVIIRPFINRNYPDYVKALKRAGVNVVSLYPVDANNFDDYIHILGMLSGKEVEALEQLNALNTRISEIEALTHQVPVEARKNVYFESTKTAYRTVTIDSNPAKAIEYAGGINIASDVKPMTKGSTIAEFGIEKLMIHADEIDIYVSQRGAMNSGGSLISIPQREGFKAIKAVNEGKILEINEKIISSPTLRYDKGVREIARMLYPEIMDDLSKYKTDEPLTREVYAQITVKMSHAPLFVPSSSHYYEKNHIVHTYGLFKDVSFEEKAYDYIETAVLNSFIKGYKDEDGNEYFDKEGLITREDLAYTLYIMLDVQSVDNHREIKDLSACTDGKIVQKIVDNGLMDLENDQLFNPKETMTQNQGITILSEGLKRYNENSH